MKLQLVLKTKAGETRNATPSRDGYFEADPGDDDAIRSQLLKAIEHPNDTQSGFATAPYFVFSPGDTICICELAEDGIPEPR